MTTIVFFYCLLKAIKRFDESANWTAVNTKTHSIARRPKTDSKRFWNRSSERRRRRYWHHRTRYLCQYDIRMFRTEVVGFSIYYIWRSVDTDPDASKQTNLTKNCKKKKYSQWWHNNNTNYSPTKTRPRIKIDGDNFRWRATNSSVEIASVCTWNQAAICVTAHPSDLCIQSIR